MAHRSKLKRETQALCAAPSQDNASLPVTTPNQKGSFASRHSSANQPAIQQSRQTGSAQPSNSAQTAGNTIQSTPGSRLIARKSSYQHQPYQLPHHSLQVPSGQVIKNNGFKHYFVELNETEREILEEIILHRIASPSVRTRAIVLHASDIHGRALSDENVSRLCGLTSKAVAKLRKRFVEDGFERTLRGTPTIPRHHTFTKEQEDKVVQLFQEPAPNGKKWTFIRLTEEVVRRGIVEKVSIGTIRRLIRRRLGI